MPKLKAKSIKRRKYTALAILLLWCLDLRVFPQSAGTYCSSCTILRVPNFKAMSVKCRKHTTPVIYMVPRFKAMSMKCRRFTSVTILFFWCLDLRLCPQSAGTYCPSCTIPRVPKFKAMSVKCGNIPLQSYTWCQDSRLCP